VIWPVSEILSQSSNVGAIKLAEGVGKEKLYEALRSFGFGQKTSIDFPNEAGGTVGGAGRLGLLVTGLDPDRSGCGRHAAPDAGCLQRDRQRGRVRGAKLVGAMVDGDGTRHATADDPGRRVISQSTSDKMNVMLRSVVKQGTERPRPFPANTSAGKTGTAKIPQPGGYQDARASRTTTSTFRRLSSRPKLPPCRSSSRSPIPARRILRRTVAAPAFAKIGAAALRSFGVVPPTLDLAQGWCGDRRRDHRDGGSRSGASATSAVTPQRSTGPRHSA